MKPEPAADTILDDISQFGLEPHRQLTNPYPVVFRQYIRSFSVRKNQMPFLRLDGKFL